MGIAKTWTPVSNEHLLSFAFQNKQESWDTPLIFNFKSPKSECQTHVTTSEIWVPALPSGHHHDCQDRDQKTTHRWTPGLRLSS